MIKKYTQFIKEADQTGGVQSQGETNTDESSTGDVQYDEVKGFVKEKIQSTIEKSGGEFDSFVDKFIKEPRDVKIEGLINDSDIYDFYLKFRNDIDEILNKVNFFDQNPSEMNAFGLYEYTIRGTEKVIEEIVKMF